MVDGRENHQRLDATTRVEVGVVSPTAERCVYITVWSDTARPTVRCSPAYARWLAGELIGAALRSEAGRD